MWIKICGIQDLATAVEVARLEPQAIGLNFYSQTPRHVSVDVAAEIVRALPPTVEPVGVFVNHGVDEICEFREQCGIRAVQLHGDETAAFAAQLAERLSDCRLIRALRIGEDGIESLANYFDTCRQAGAIIDACLVDARVAGKYGGTGQRVDWELLAREYRRDEWPKLILAGGLTPDNVADAIRTVQPWGVDVASGVESSPGVKDLEIVERFIENARQAFA